jgi:hypothetical protein
VQPLVTNTRWLRGVQANLAAGVGTLERPNH